MRIGTFFTSTMDVRLVASCGNGVPNMETLSTLATLPSQSPHSHPRMEEEGTMMGTYTQYSLPRHGGLSARQTEGQTNHCSDKHVVSSTPLGKPSSVPQSSFLLHQRQEW